VVASVSIGDRAERPLGLHRDARPAAVLAPTGAAFCWVISSIWLAALLSSSTQKHCCLLGAYQRWI